MKLWLRHVYLYSGAFFYCFIVTLNLTFLISISLLSVGALLNFVTSMATYSSEFPSFLGYNFIRINIHLLYMYVYITYIYAIYAIYVHVYIFICYTYVILYKKTCYIYKTHIYINKWIYIFIWPNERLSSPDYIMVMLVWFIRISHRYRASFLPMLFTFLSFALSLYSLNRY